MKQFLLSLLIISICTSVRAQVSDTLGIFTDRFSVESNKTVEIPIKVWNYDKIESIQFSINWNPYHLEFIEISDINPDSDIDIEDIGLFRVDQGIVILSFIDPVTGGISLPDSSYLFTIKMKAIGAPSEKTLLNISGYDRQIDAYGQGVFRTVKAGKSRNTITSPSQLQMYTTACSVSKPAQPNGEINVKADGGEPPIRLYFNKIGGQEPTLSTIGNGSTLTYDSLSAGAYELRLSDNSGTEIRDTIDLNIVQGWAMDLQLTPPSCSNTKDGAAFVNYLSGYVEPYVITWSTFDLLNPHLDNISSGSYYIRVEDKMGCVYEELFSFKLPEPEVLIETSPSSCIDIHDGEAYIKIIDADSTGQYTISLDNRNPVDTHEITFTGLASGKHSVSITDSESCEYIYDFFIDIEHQMEILDTTVLNIGCDGSLGGFLVEVRDTGVTGGDITARLVPDIGSIDTADGFISVQNLPKGEYTLYLNFKEFPDLCGDSLSFTIDASDLIEITTIHLTDETCAGANNASINISASGGLGSFYTYSWSDEGDSTALREDLQPGTYCVTITDDSGCIIDSCYTVKAGTAYEFQVDTIRDSSCPGAPDGYFAFTLSHLSGPQSDTFKLETTPAIRLTIQDDSTYIADSLTAGSYHIKILNENNCTIDTFINIGEPRYPTITLDSIADAGCFNFPQGHISLSASLDGDSSTYVKWLWDTGDTTSTISELTAGTYEVTITDINGCVTTRDYFIDSLGGPFVEAITFISPRCYGDSNGSIEITSISSRSGVEVIRWDGKDTTALLDSIPAGSYFYEVIDSSGCTIADTVTLHQPDSLSVAIETEPQRGETLGTATASISGGTMPYELNWSTNPPITDTTKIEAPAGNYSLVVVDSHVCIEISNFSIEDVTSIHKNTSRDILLYPNPTDGVLFLQIDGAEEFNCPGCTKMDIQILNNQGQVVPVDYNQAGDLITLYTKTFIPGTYYMILSHNGKVLYNNKFTVQR